MPKCGLLGFAGLFAALGSASCDTGADGVQECRDIELARCEAARNCGLGIDSDDDAEACRRYARDNCLHGLSSAIPKASELDRCVSTIKKAGACISEQGAEATAAECDLGTVIPATATACEIVQDPDEAETCRFLLTDPPKEEPEPEPEPTDAGGD